MSFQFCKSRASLLTNYVVAPIGPIAYMLVLFAIFLGLSTSVQNLSLCSMTFRVKNQFFYDVQGNVVSVILRVECDIIYESLNYVWVITT